jgi:hypothetical protein
MMLLIALWRLPMTACLAASQCVSEYVSYLVEEWKTYRTIVISLWIAGCVFVALPWPSTVLRWLIRCVFFLALAGATLVVLKSELTFSWGDPPSESHTIGPAGDPVDSRRAIAYGWMAAVIGASSGVAIRTAKLCLSAVRKE